jgi:hypothetical protein
VTTSSSSNINNASKKDEPSGELWTTRAIKDELTFQLSSVCSLKIDEKTHLFHIVHKYYDRADFVLYRINIYRPPPVFIINLSDITPKLQSELDEVYKSSPKTFDRVVTNAIQCILESVNKRYYHVSNIAYKVCLRFEP